MCIHKYIHDNISVCSQLPAFLLPNFIHGDRDQGQRARGGVLVVAVLEGNVAREGVQVFQKAAPVGWLDSLVGCVSHMAAATVRISRII